jgi:hypothetical protein
MRGALGPVGCRACGSLVAIESPGMPPITPELQGAITNAYEVFAHYSLGGTIEVCRYDVCVLSQAERELIETPLREIPRALLAEYTSSAPGYAEGKIANDFRYLLPRYLELIANDEFPTLNLESETLSRLGSANYRNLWPQAEVTAVDRFFDAWLVATLTAPIALRRQKWDVALCGTAIADVVGTIVNAGGDVTSLLDLWSAAEGRTADLRLAVFAIDLVDPIVSEWHAAREHETLRNMPFDIEAMNLWLEQEFFDGRRCDAHTATAPVIIEWLGRASIRGRLEQAFLREENPDVAAMFSLAETIVKGIAIRFRVTP